MAEHKKGIPQSLHVKVVTADVDSVSAEDVAAALKNSGFSVFCVLVRDWDMVRPDDWWHNTDRWEDDHG